MDEPFPSFTHNFRVLYQSLLALSSSALVAISLIVVNHQHQLGATTLNAYRSCIFFFALTIAIAILASYVGLSHEVNDGKGGDLSPRKINDRKFKIISIALVPFCIGFISFVVTLMTLP